MKIFNWVFFIVFLVFGVLQFNDPDPEIWVPLYLVPALLSLRIAAGNPVKGSGFMGLLLTFAVVYWIFAFILFPASSAKDWWTAEQEAKSLKMKVPFVEEARESLGLMICAVVLTINALNFRKRKRR